MNRLAAALLPLLLAACGGGEGELLARARTLHRASLLVARIEEPGMIDRIIAADVREPVLDALLPSMPPRVRHLAAIATGRMGGPGAGEALLALFDERSGDFGRDGARMLYAAVGFTLLGDPAFAVDLVERLSTVDPNNAVAALGAEERTEEYFTVDAQLCDALLSIGVWNAEEELLKQLRRRDRIRVLIDAHAVLRRHTGLNLPFRYNGSYADRAADADRWAALLRATRPERVASRPFRSDTARFRNRCEEVVAWLGGRSVNQRYIAYKILPILGRAATPFLVTELRSANPIGQRQAAFVLGRIGDPAAAPDLRAAASHADDDARAEAVRALLLVGDRGALDLVRERLADPDPEVRGYAARYLGTFGADGDRSRLAAALGRERAPSTVTELLCALLRRGDRSVVGRLCDVYRSGEQLDREAALQALEECAGEKSGGSALDDAATREKTAALMEGWFR